MFAPSRKRNLPFAVRHSELQSPKFEVVPAGDTGLAVYLNRNNIKNARDIWQLTPQSHDLSVKRAFIEFEQSVRSFADANCISRHATVDERILEEKIYSMFKTASFYDDEPSSALAEVANSQIAKYGASAVHAIMNIAIQNQDSLSSFLLSFLSELDHPGTHHSRLDFLKSLLGNSDSSIRISGVLGLVQFASELDMAEIISKGTNETNPVVKNAFQALIKEIEVNSELSSDSSN